MTLADDPVAQHRRARGGFGAVVMAASEAGKWGAPSPCTEWDARDVVEHVLGSHDVLVLKPLDARPTRPKDDLVARWQVTDDALAHALDRADLDEKLRSLIGVLATDVLVHTWDLSCAVGMAVTLDPELCEIGYERAKANLAQLEASDAFGPPISVPDDATLQDKLLAIFGRNPDWSAPAPV